MWALITEILPATPWTRDALALVELGDRMNHFSVPNVRAQQHAWRSRAPSPNAGGAVCDEPTGALDVKTGITVLEAIEKVNLELGTLTVVIRHTRLSLTWADR